MALDTLQINSIATSVATTILGSSTVANATSVPTTDSVGDPALRITIVLFPGSTDSISGDAALKTLVRLKNELREQGEDRFPIVEYDELKNSAD